MELYRGEVAGELVYQLLAEGLHAGNIVGDPKSQLLEQQSLAYQRLRRELLNAERDAVVELRRVGRIDDQVMKRVQRDLDLEDARLEI